MRVHPSRTGHRAFACASALVLALELAPAEADAATLVYQRGTGAESCPDEAELRQSVAARLGADPFTEAGGEARVVLERQDGAFVATIAIHDRAGNLRGERTLTSAASTCAELAVALAAALGVAFEKPRSVPPPTEAEPPAPAPPPPATAPSPETAMPAAPRTPGPHVETFAGAGGAFGVAPSGAAAFTAGVGLGWPQASVGLEARTTLPASDSVGAGTVTSTLVTGTLVPCLRRGLVGACALGTIGSLHGKGSGVQVPTRASALYAAAGARAQVEVPLSAAVWFRAGGDLVATIQGARLVLDGQEAWTLPLFSGALWAGAAFHFP